MLCGSEKSRVTGFLSGIFEEGSCVIGNGVSDFGLNVIESRFYSALIGVNREPIAAFNT